MQDEVLLGEFFKHHEVFSSWFGEGSCWGFFLGQIPRGEMTASLIACNLERMYLWPADRQNCSHQNSRSCVFAGFLSCGPADFWVHTFPPECLTSFSWPWSSWWHIRMIHWTGSFHHGVIMRNDVWACTPSLIFLATWANSLCAWEKICLPVL